ARPHEPQLLTLVPTLVSHPSAYWKSQSRKPALQAAMVHVLAVHAGWPFATTHTFPQAPQSIGLLVVLVSQPSISLSLLQSTNPLEHMPLHTLLMQVRV